MGPQRQFQATLWRRLGLLLLVSSLPLLWPTSAWAEPYVTFITVDQSDRDIWQADKELRTYLEQGIDPPGRKFNQIPITYEEIGWTLARWESDGGGGSHVARVTPYVYVAAEMLGADLEVLGTYESTATDSVVYHSYFVVNRDHLSLPAGEPPRLHHLLEWLRSQSEPAKFTYHSRFSTSSYFVPSLFFRRNRIFSMRGSATEGVIRRFDAQSGDRLETLVAQSNVGDVTFRLVLQEDGVGGHEALLEARRDDGSFATTLVKGSIPRGEAVEVDRSSGTTQRSGADAPIDRIDSPVAVGEATELARRDAVDREGKRARARRGLPLEPYAASAGRQGVDRHLPAG